MQAGPSILSISAGMLYLVVLAVCSGALLASSGTGQTLWHRLVWLGLAGWFGFLTLLRFLNAEALIRDELRQVLRSVGWQDDRRFLQGMIAFAFLIVCAVIGFMFARRLFRLIRSRHDIATVLAMTAGAFLGILLTLRLISLHAIDGLLFGPLKLNWLGDIGATLAVLACGVFYICIKPVRRYNGQRR